MANENKLVLGTVQFGMDYGINNSVGQVSESEVFKILAYASDSGIDMLDTAHTYGNSEEIIGKFIKRSSKTFKIISKVPKPEAGKNIASYLKESLKNLNSTKLYAYLFHNFDSYKENPQLLEQLQQLKRSSKVEKIGFSLYYPMELDYLLENKIDFDIVQVPYSIFDQRFESRLEQLKKLGKEVHVRSVFLQGLVFKNLEELAPEFFGIKSQLKKLIEISKLSKVRIAGLCLNFAALNKNIDRIVIGVDSLANLEENILDLTQGSKASKYYNDLKTLLIDDEQIILPTNWKKK